MWYERKTESQKITKKGGATPTLPVQSIRRIPAGPRPLYRRFDLKIPVFRRLKTPAIPAEAGISSTHRSTCRDFRLHGNNRVNNENKKSGSFKSNRYKLQAVYTALKKWTPVKQQNAKKERSQLIKKNEENTRWISNRTLSYTNKSGPQNKIFTLLLGMSAVIWASCGETPRQYETPSTAPILPDEEKPIITPSLSPYTVAFLADRATHPTGGLLIYDKPVETEAEKDGKTRKNSLVPINYQEQSAGNISMETEYEESLDILNFNATSGPYTIYKEGIAVIWRDDAPRIPDAIFILNSYQGTLDFGPFMGGGDKRHARVGQSFSDQFSAGETNIIEDPKARSFITSLYRHLEEKDEDCLLAQTCNLNINPQGNYIYFQLPKMTLLFGNNERRKLTQIAMLRNDDPACFNSPFDLVTAQFSCEQGDGSKITFGLGDSYKEVLEKSGIPRDLPITYENTFLYQRARAVIAIWKRNNFEEKVRAIPEDSHLSAVLMGDHEYSIPFLINESLVKVSLTSRDTVRLSLDPLAEEGQQWTMGDIIKKQEAANKDSKVFYLATEMPQIKDNYSLQKNLISALLDLLEKSHTKLNSAQNSTIQIHKRIFGNHNDKFALKAAGFLTVRKTNDSGDAQPLKFHIEINESSGRGEFILSLGDDDFEKYILENQSADLDLSKPAEGLLGFKLGDRIYLRDKKPGPGTAITAYPVEDGRTLITLAGYSDESESSAVYPAGRDKNIIFEKSSMVSVQGATFYIHPTFQTKDIEGRNFDEYEISKITVASQMFGSIRSLCGIENFDVNMGLHDREFSKRLADEIQKAQADSTDERSFQDCFYMAPTDILFSGVKRAFFFPKHNLILGFADRELFSLMVYKKPPENKGASQ